MAESNLTFLLLLFLLSTPLAESGHSSKSTSFIRSACTTSTRYPTLCFRSLSAYADRIGLSNRQLAAVALAISLARTQTASLSLSRLSRTVNGSKPGRRDLAALRDCTSTVGDGARQLGHSEVELGRAMRPGGREFAWHVSNVETWVSAALTNMQTCVDGFAGRSSVKDAVMRRMAGVAEATSVALALVNRFVAGRG